MVKKATNHKSEITALARKVNRPRVTLRTEKTPLTKPEKCVITLVYGILGIGKGVWDLNPFMLGYNFGAFYSPTGHTLLTPSALRDMRRYLKKYNIEDWTNER